MTRLDRSEGAVVGLAIGDAAGWPARQHRAQLLPPWTRRLRRELDAFAEDHGVTALPVSFALNQETSPLRLGPSDDAEWAAWTLSWLTQARRETGELSRPRVHDVWADAAIREGLPQGRISVAAAGEGLRRGLRPPVTGHDNPHHFDDAAAVRAVAIGAVLGDPDRSATVAEWDAEVTNAGDGLAAARGVSRGVASAVGGETVAVVVGRVVDELPSDTLVGRTARDALALTADADSPAAAVPLLDDLVDRVYSYGTAAAQTVPVALALFAVAGRTGASPIDTITAATCLSSMADSAPALTGALVGAAGGRSSFPESWVARCRAVDGCCAASLAGADVIELVGRTLT